MLLSPSLCHKTKLNLIKPLNNSGVYVPPAITIRNTALCLNSTLV